MAAHRAWVRLHKLISVTEGPVQLMEIGRDGEGGDDALQHVMAGKRDAIEPVPIPLRPMAEKIALVTKWKK